MRNRFSGVLGDKEMTVGKLDAIVGRIVAEVVSDGIRITLEVGGRQLEVMIPFDRVTARWKDAPLPGQEPADE